ncbi:exodeoxyribonuclease III [Candidatus Nomurabacteria bacterium CG1_02_31_12]|uniref:Exodeoxyribonuclease III n=1 Tax=Candidatus Nomurabacteria bacterium CG1_02_31_12 TaxID=1805280 RepID=A0A1J4UYY0_9BACT|nr:MAG: exodeoxyribonuclease III [Candidatus Nomurabacteria bacterium CG1_02_31_12]
MKIVSWNTNGLRATAKQGFLIPIFEKGKVDILCLQETKVEPEQLDETVKNIPGYYSYFAYSKLRKGYSGVAIYSKEKPKEVLYGMGIKKFDDEGRLLITKYENKNKNKNKKLTIITGYFPNGGSGPHRLKYKLEFYDAFLKFILKLRKNGEHVIFCGDINTAHTPIDLARSKANEENTGFLPIERTWISKVIKNNFIDVFRYFYPDKVGAYTYWDQKTRARDRNIGWRLDYFFADKYFFNKKNGIKKTGISTDHYGSDHCPIWIEI